MTYGSQTTCFKDNFTSCNESGASTGCPESEKLNGNTNCVVVWCLEKNDQQLCLAFLGQLD